LILINQNSSNWLTGLLDDLEVLFYIFFSSGFYFLDGYLILKILDLLDKNNC